MRRFLVFSLTSLLCLSVSSVAQIGKGTVTGSVTDASRGVLQGARVQLQPGSETAVTGADGRYTLTGVAPGHYTVTVSYIGFAPFSKDVSVTAGSVVNATAVLQVSSRSEQVTVRGERQVGEVAALNRERTADNIVQVLPSEVITSLPNTNIADAVGRLPSVSLERDEGEGKYVQIRGTEPRLSNVTINGMHMASPEGIRNVKLDVIPAELVDSVEVSKTLQADQDADAIGGSVNLVTRTPADRPYFSILSMGGYTPIVNGRTSDQFAATAGQRFGHNKKFGIILGGSYDHNNRGINDVEPVAGANTLPDGSTFYGFNTADIRDYAYNRSRYGFAGGLDYKLGDMSSLYLHGMLAHFNDFGQDWIYSPTVGNFLTPTTTDNTGNISMTQVYRRPKQRLFGVQAGARHVLGSYLLVYEIGTSQAYYRGGYPSASFDGPSNIAFGVNTTGGFTPTFPVLNGVNIYDPATYTLGGLRLGNESTFERDVVGSINLSKQYSIGSHYSTFAVGMKVWDGAKDQIYNDTSFSANATVPMSQFTMPFSDPNYYFGRYKFGPVTNFNKILAYFNGNPTAFSGGPNVVSNLGNDFNIGERIYAGYLMNTVTLGRVRLQTGVRVESTSDALLGNNVLLDNNGDFSSVTPLTRNHSYTDVFPSVQAQFRLTDNTDLRTSYGMGIARPDFVDISPGVTFDPTSVPPVSAGNPALLPTHAQNFDIVLERYLKPIGILQGGFFYKYLTDPIYYVASVRTAAPYAGSEQIAPVNGPNAYVTGIELSWEQQLRFLPGAFNGMGVRANYSYTTSRATFPSGFGRSDKPALDRQAPNNLNFDVTYDKKGISARMGLSHNDAYIWSYGYQDGADGGITGPNGDTYLYPHTQIDAQVSYLLPKSHGLHVIASFLNLNNEVFGFYNGSEKYPIQREYYSPTYSFGLRWTSEEEHAK
ncbi:MAG: TonB-dependent receptor [Terriglobales bacterium]